MIDRERLRAGYDKARAVLLGQRHPAGHWVGQLSASALSTATAISALALVERRQVTDASGRFWDESRQSQLSRLIVRGLQWLADHQNEDGGWGDTDRSHSNIATTMLAVAAFHMTGVPADRCGLLERATDYIDQHGGLFGLRARYGKDKTFAAPILATYALAGLVRWREVPALPFELACVPQQLYRFLQLPVVSYAVPALVGIGQLRFAHAKPLNPFSRLLRRASVERSWGVARRMQPASGGYLEAIPLTSFVIMSLADLRRTQDPIVQRGVQFLVDTVRPDGSWPIDTNLATWNTTLAVNALAASGENVVQLCCWDWLLGCQHQQTHPFTGAEPGGWGWNDLSGAVPDADDTAGAVLALAHCFRQTDSQQQRQVAAAAASGLRWLLSLQNSDGGWPTFCRGWTRLPFDRSGADLTAHALRAMVAWEHILQQDDRQADGTLAGIFGQPVVTSRKLQDAVQRGLAYLLREQRADGSWVPLWFGNQDWEGEENPLYGTARVLQALRDLKLDSGEAAARGRAFLLRMQNQDGGWGSGALTSLGRTSSVEETALVTEALLSVQADPSLQVAVEKGLDWLLGAVESDQHSQCAPIGFYFAKLWYYERLYPLSFTVSALGQAITRWLPRPERQPTTAHLPRT